MLKVAITGNIASGKSEVEKIIENFGYPVFDTDKIAHDILKSNSDVEKIFGTTNRKNLAKIVFSDKTKLKILENIIHPLVKEKIKEIFFLDYSVVFISVPQLFESGFDRMFDKIIFISADKKIRLERLMKRNNIDSKEALIRINAQEDEINKIKKSDFIILNNEGYEQLNDSVQNILKKLNL